MSHDAVFKDEEPCIPSCSGCGSLLTRNLLCIRVPPGVLVTACFPEVGAELSGWDEGSWLAVESLLTCDLSHFGSLTSQNGEHFLIVCVGSLAHWVTPGRWVSSCPVPFRGCPSLARSL